MKPLLRRCWQRAAGLRAGLVMMLALASAAQVHAQVPMPAAASAPVAVPPATPVLASALLLPWPSATLQALLRTSPVAAAAQAQIEAERAVQRQLAVGPQEWTASLAAARRQERGGQPAASGEWELTVERPWRSAAKAQAAEQLGRSRSAAAQAAASRVQREQGRLLLLHTSAWLREREAAEVWVSQLAVLQQQRDTTLRRQRLGDAAAIDTLQAEAAVTQAQAQLAGANGRAEAALSQLITRWPGLDTAAAQAALRQALALSQTPPAAGQDDALVEAQLRASPELAIAEHELQLAQAQQRQDEAEQRPDPTLGLRVGTARNGSEQLVGVVMSLPFGGEHRRSGAQAAAARSQAAGHMLDQARLQAHADALLRLHDWHTRWAQWQAQAQAARQLAGVAERLARGYALGDGSLSDLLAARRLAQEQQLAAAQAAVDVLAAQWVLGWDAANH